MGRWAGLGVGGRDRRGNCDDGFVYYGPVFY